MKGSFAKAARIIDALRIKMEAGAPVVSEPTANNAEAEVPASAATTEDVVVAEAPEEVTTPEATPETEEKE
jgi:large subunit ribosomal protein L10